MFKKSEGDKLMILKKVNAKKKFAMVTVGNEARFLVREKLKNKTEKM